jgi:hypothetical protein
LLYDHKIWRPFRRPAHHIRSTSKRGANDSSSEAGTFWGFSSEPSGFGPVAWPRESKRRSHPIIGNFAQRGIQDHADCREPRYVEQSGFHIDGRVAVPGPVPACFSADERGTRYEGFVDRLEAEAAGGGSKRFDEFGIARQGRVIGPPHLHWNHHRARCEVVVEATRDPAADDNVVQLSVGP